MNSITRRNFLKSAAMAGLAAGMPKTAMGGERSSPAAGPSETIRLAVIGMGDTAAVGGVGGRGHQLIGRLQAVPGARIVALCDVDRAHLDREAKPFKDRGEAIATHTDLRRILDDKTIDAVVIALPNHWHALATVWACQAGKDVYIEKPFSHNLWEGRQMVAAARRYGRMVQVGTQNRSSTFLRRTFDELRGGAMGAIRCAYALVYRARDGIGTVSAPTPVPATVDYDLWCGPAAKIPLMRQSNFVWSIDPRLGDTNAYRIRLTSIVDPALQDASDAAFSVTGSGVPPNPAFGQPLLLNGGFESLTTHWETIAGKPAILGIAHGKGAPMAGARFLHGGLSPGGDMVLSQEIDLLEAGFAACDLDEGAVVEAEAWLRSAHALGTYDDQVSFRVGCLDAIGREMSAMRSMIGGDSTWVRRTLAGLLPPGTRRLRVEVAGRHRRDADNDSMVDEVAVCLQRAWPIVQPKITKLPMLQDFRQDAMTLIWETDGNLALHGVDWGRDSVSERACAPIETVCIDGTHFVHCATLAGLSPETSYVYRVRSGSAASPVFAFRTAPRRDTPFAVAWWADSQSNPAILRQLIPRMLERGVDWMGVAGDMASNGSSLSDWHNYWFTPLEFQNLAQTRPVLFARGNHDGEGPLSYAYSALPGNESWFAFDYGNSRFIFLDSEASTSAAPEQFAWLTSELARAETQRAAFRIVCFHKLPYANLWNGGGYTGEAWVRNDWVPLFQQHHVDLVINGHAHNYNRGATNGVTYVVVGGGGGELDTERVARWPLFTVEHSLYHYARMAVAGHTLTWEVFSNTGQPLDRIVLTSRLPLLELENPEPAAETLPLTVRGKPDTAYILERSADLSAWSMIATQAIPAAGFPAITHTVSTTAAQSFYRARATP